MTSPTHTRFLTCLVGVALAAGMITACASEPDPEPTKTPVFASEEEAFAAAEETYRAYTDALNNIDLSEPSTFEPVFALESGEAKSSTKEFLSGLHADGVAISGANVIVSFIPKSAEPASGSVDALACVDVHQIQLKNPDGSSALTSEQPDLQALQLTFSKGATQTGLTISSSISVEKATCTE